MLTFEGLKNEAAVGNHYDEGDDGISFGPDALALVASSAAGGGNLSGNPSGSTALFFTSGAGAYRNVAAGFGAGFSFYYAGGIGFTGSIKAFDGLNGTGNQLASLSLPSTPSPYPTSCRSASPSRAPPGRCCSVARLPTSRSTTSRWAPRRPPPPFPRPRPRR